MKKQARKTEEKEMVKQDEIDLITLVKTLWQDRFPRHRAKYYGSPVIAGSKLYAPREDGVILVAAIDKGFQLLGQNQMGQQVIASPVPVNNRLLIRGAEHLFCIGDPAD